MLALSSAVRALDGSFEDETMVLEDVVAALNVIEHLVEAVHQLADLVVAFVDGADAVVARSRHGARDLA